MAPMPEDLSPDIAVVTDAPSSRLQESKKSQLQPSVIILATGGSFLLLVFIILTSLYLFSRTRSYSEQATHTQSVITDIVRINGFAREAESGQRGYLLTGNQRYLDAFLKAKSDLPDMSEKLQNDLGSDAAARADARQLADIVSQKLAELQSTIDLKSQGHGDAALAIVNTDRGLNLMKAIVATAQRMIAAQQQILADHFDSGRDTARLSFFISLLASIFIVVLAWLSIRSTSRLLGALRVSRVDLANANETLEQTVAERTADLSEANEELQRYAYIVSHDLRSPLVNVMGFTSEVDALHQDAVKLLEDSRGGRSLDAGEVERLSQDFREAIGFIKTSTDKMDRLIAAILKLAREGRRSFADDLLDLTALVKSIVAGEAHRAHELGAEISVGMLPPVTGDRLAMEQIFGNLVDNALKYLKPNRPGLIEITGRQGRRAKIYEVKDNGRGIDPRDHQRVFELFRRSGNQNVPGEGIGLAHVRALVRAMGGIITCDSALDRGTTFTLRFPTKS